MTENRICNKTVCGRQIQMNHHSIKCERCSKVYHKKCSGINETIWKQFLAGEMLYNCSTCKAKRKSSVIIPSSPKVDPKTSSSTPSDDTIGDINLDEVKTGLFEFKSSLSTMQAFNSEVSASLSNLHDTVTSIETKLRYFENKFKVVEEVQAENTRFRNQLMLLDKRVTDLESAKTSPKTKKTLNIPEMAVTIGGINCDENLNLTDAVSKVFRGLDLEPPSTGIKKISAKNGKAFILVPLKSRQMLEDTVKASRTLKLNAESLGMSGSNIYVNERLSQNSYQLLCDAKKLKEQGYKFIWSRYGKVFARKQEGSIISHLKTKSDVDALISNH